MNSHSQNPIKGLTIWADILYQLPENRDMSDDKRIRQYQTAAARLPDIGWDFSSLPVLPIFSLDPTNRLDNILANPDVWLTPHPTLETGRYTILKFAGSLEQQDALWLDWEDVRASHRHPGKRFMLDASTFFADQGIVFLLAPNAGDDLLYLWQYYLSHIVYNARAVYGIGPGDFNWPVPVTWLAASIDAAEAQIRQILAEPNLETFASTINLDMFIEPYGDDDMHEAMMPDYHELEETPRMVSSGEVEDTTLRLDTAVPEKVYLGEVFDLAVAVRQLISPILQEQDLARIHSGEIQIAWPAGQDTFQLRIEVSAPTCEIVGESFAKFRLRYGEDSPVFYFQLSPKRLGTLSVIVKVYQEDYWLGSARIRTQVSDEPVGVVETTVTSHNLALTHTDLEIRIGKFEDNLAGYPVQAQISNGSHFDNGVLAVDEGLLPTISHPMDYGDYLWEMLFTGPAYDAYLAASAVAATATEERLRVRLWIDDDAPSLHAIVWERLLNRQQTPPQPMSISAKRPFSRYLGISQSVPEPIHSMPIRMLFIVSNPPDLGGLPSLDVNLELANILKVVEDQPNLKITVLAGENSLSTDLKAQLLAGGHAVQEAYASLDNIIRALTGTEQVNILHILAHGRYVQLRGASELYLQDNGGFTKIVSDNDITLRLGAVSPLPHLVFLAACESASRHPGSHNAYVGLASKLVACGVPAVVAMQDMLPIDAAQKLTGDFYAYLMQHGVVDRALAQARLLLFDTSSPIWSTPVLYMRFKDGLLFDLGTE